MHVEPVGAEVMGSVRAVPIRDETCAAVSTAHDGFDGGVCDGATTRASGRKKWSTRSSSLESVRIIAEDPLTICA
jgi:hypothetical protein